MIFPSLRCVLTPQISKEIFKYAHTQHAYFKTCASIHFVSKIWRVCGLTRYKAEPGVQKFLKQLKKNCFCFKQNRLLLKYMKSNIVTLF